MLEDGMQISNEALDSGSVKFRKPETAENTAAESEKQTMEREQPAENGAADGNSKDINNQVSEKQYKLSDEKDEQGISFVLSPDGTSKFGEITSDTGLEAAPIKLSEGKITNEDTNEGYGLIHIEKRHGDQIRDAGFKSVEDFVSYVAKNYDKNDIRYGVKKALGGQSYLIQIKDAHNNTLYIELSKDGSYWNVTSGGVFRKGYGKNRDIVDPTSARSAQGAVPDGNLRSATNAANQADPNGNASTNPAGKVTENNSNGKIDAGNSTAKELIEGRAERRREEVREQESQQAQTRAAMSDEQRLVYDAVSDRLDKAGIKVELATEEEAKEGVDYFRGSDGRVLGWADKDGGIHLTQAGMNPETPIHEYSHLWSRAMRRNHPEVWSSIVELCKQNKTLWDDVAKDPNYAHLNGDADAITSEIMSRYVGREGAKRLEGVARRMYAEAQRNGTMKDSVSVGTYVSRVKQTVLNFWNKVAEMLGIRRFKHLREVERSVISDLIDGRKYSAEEISSSSNEHAFYGRKGAENLDAARGDRVNQENLSVAERMEQAGKNARAIKLATGWERGADGKWRMEMPDIKIKKDALNHINEYGVIDLRDLVEDDNLLSAYPEYSFAENYDPKTGEYEGMSMGIGDMSVEFANGLRNAYYDEEMHRIMIPSFYISVIGKGNENKLRDVLVHEIQHAIQEVEGFARGEDPSNGSFDAYRRSAGETESRNVERRMDYSDRQRRESLASDTEDVPRDEQIVRFGDGESQQAWMQGDFKTRQTEAVDNKGRVAPNLKEQSVNVVGAKAEHGFANFDEARSWAKENIVGTVKANENRSGVDITISNTAVNKFLSQSSVEKSASADVHLAVLKVLPDVIKESIDAEQHPDYNKGADGARAADNGYNQDVLVHRLYGAVEIDGKTYRVKTTVTEHISEKGQGRSHSYEATEIELLAGQHEAVAESTRVGAPTSRNSNSSISAAKLLENVEKSYDPGKKLLDESLSTSGSSVSASVADPLGNARERVQRRRSNSSLDDFIAQELGMTAERMSQSLQELPQRVRDGMEDRLNGIGERLERIGALDSTERELEKMFTEEYDWSQREQTREAVEEHLRQVRNERELLVNEIRSLEEELDNTLLNRDLFYEDTKPEGLGKGEKSNDASEQREGMLGEDYEPFRATDFNGLTAEEAVWAGIRQNAERTGREGVEGLRRVAQTMRSAYEAVRKGMGIADGNAKDMGTWLRALVALSDGEFSKGQVKRLLSAARKGTKAEQSEAMRSAVDVLSRHYVRAGKERMVSLLDLGDRSSDGGMRVAGATVGREQVILSSAKRYILDEGLNRVERREALNEELSRLGDSNADMSRREDIEAELEGLDLAEAYDRSARVYEQRVAAIEEDIKEINGKYYEQRGIQYCIPLCICSNQIFILTLWSIGDSNSLPLRCERSALPDELIPQKCNAKLRLFIEISNLKKEYEKNNSNYRNGIMYLNARLHKKKL